MSGWGSSEVGVGGAVEDWRSALFPRLVRLQLRPIITILTVTILIITILTVTILIITVFIITIPTITILIILIITILVTILSSLTREKFDNEIAIATRS